MALRQVIVLIQVLLLAQTFLEFMIALLRRNLRKISQKFVIISIAFLKYNRYIEKLELLCR